MTSIGARPGDLTARAWWSRLLVLVLAVATLPAVSSRAGASSQDLVAPPSSAGDESAFHFDDAAAEALHTLWRTSSAVRQEQVACIGGYRSGAGWRVTRIQMLVAASDSFGVAAGTSIERCGPPNWFGTVHTHVAVRADGQPYSTFSGADRGVMALWWRRWRVPGVFCILYSDHDAHCEADGHLVAGPGTRATY